MRIVVFYRLSGWFIATTLSANLAVSREYSKNVQGGGQSSALSKGRDARGWNLRVTWRSNPHRGVRRARIPRPARAVPNRTKVAGSGIPVVGPNSISGMLNDPRLMLVLANVTLVNGVVDTIPSNTN